MRDAMVVARNVHKRFGSLEVLKGIEIEVGAGDVLCLIGRSGSGKTTFLRCVNRLEAIDDGAIWVDGEIIGYRLDSMRLYHLSDRAVCRQRENIGMVFQRFNLFPHMTALSNVTFGPVKIKRRAESEVTPEAMALLERVGLADKASSYPAQLSGGQQQRVAIARALAMRPKLMLFDEPTSALDPELVGDVLRVMEGLAREGMTMIVVTHEMSFARDVATKVAYLDGGEVVETGTPEEIISNPQNASTKRFLSRVGNV